MSVPRVRRVSTLLTPSERGVSFISVIEGSGVPEGGAGVVTVLAPPAARNLRVVRGGSLVESGSTPGSLTP